MNRPTRKKQLSSKVSIATGAILAAITILTGAALAAGAFPVTRRNSSRPPQNICLNNAKQLGLALIMYSGDWDDQLPPSGRWSDAISPYVRTNTIYRCPSGKNKICGYALNEALAGNKYAATSRSQAAQTVMLFESDKGWNATGGKALLPKQPRHSSGDIFVYGDGHTMLVRREQKDPGWTVKGK